MTANPALEFQTLHEFVKAARNRLSPDIWDYLIGGTETETTLKRNRRALDSVAFRPRVLRDVSGIDCTTRFLDSPLRLPIAIAPVGSLESFHPDGGVTAAKAAAEFGCVSIHSSVSKPDIETIAAAADGCRVFQLYVRGDDDFVDEHVRRAVDAGCRAFCITVDSQMYSRRERDIAKRFVKPWRLSATGINHQAAFNWDNVKRFKDRHDIPLILKGIATAEDAEMACAHGVDVIYVSNHGGRQLDHGRGALDVLPEVVATVAGRATVAIDGGFMRGTDIVKAVALGANLVGLGRLPCVGMAAGGVEGVVRMFEILEDEIRICLGLLGVTDFDQIEAAHLTRAEPLDAPHVFSAFPLLNLDDPGY